MAGRIKNIRAVDAYPRAKDFLKRLKTLADDNIIQNASPRIVPQIAQIVTQLQQAKDNIDAISGVVGLDAYARSEWQENDPAYVFTDELVIILAAVVAAGIEAKSIVPVNGAGFILEKKWAAGSASFDHPTLPAANFTTLNTLLQILSDTID